MIRVLQDWQEIGDSFRALTRAQLPTHRRVEKNWDLACLSGFLAGEPKSSSVVDLGCSGLDTLVFLSAIGFDSLLGVDLKLSWADRSYALKTAIRRKSSRLMFRVRRRDLCATRLPDHSVDVAVSISTIEHGVDSESLSRELRRILKPGGRAFITTDYWEDGIHTPPEVRPFGLPWSIASRDDLMKLIGELEKNGLELVEGDEIPRCREACVTSDGLDYTFVALGLRSVG